MTHRQCDANAKAGTGAQPAGLVCCSCHLRLTGLLEPLLRRTGNYLYEAEFVSSFGLAGAECDVCWCSFLSDQCTAAGRILRASRSDSRHTALLPAVVVRGCCPHEHRGHGFRHRQPEGAQAAGWVWWHPVCKCTGCRRGGGATVASWCLQFSCTEQLPVWTARPMCVGVSADHLALLPSAAPAFCAGALR